MDLLSTGKMIRASFPGFSTHSVHSWMESDPSNPAWRNILELLAVAAGYSQLRLNLALPGLFCVLPRLRQHLLCTVPKTNVDNGD